MSESAFAVIDMHSYCIQSYLSLLNNAAAARLSRSHYVFRPSVCLFRKTFQSKAKELIKPKFCTLMCST